MDLRKKIDTVAAMSKGMKLHLKDAEGKPMVDPDRENAPVTLTIIGQDSDQFRKLARAIAERRANDALQASGGRARVAMKIDAEQIETDSVKLAASCVIGWENIDLDGAPFVYSVENAIKLLTEFPLVKEQVENATQNRAAFLGNV